MCRTIILFLSDMHVNRVSYRYFHCFGCSITDVSCLGHSVILPASSRLPPLALIPDWCCVRSRTRPWRCLVC